MIPVLQDGKHSIYTSLQVSMTQTKVAFNLSTESTIIGFYNSIPTVIPTLTSWTNSKRP